MIKKSKFYASVLLLTTLLVYLAISTQTAKAASTLDVDNTNPVCSDLTGAPYCTIGAAITVAIDGDTIHVAAGTYNEQLTITKSLHIIGAGAGSSIVSAPVTLPTSGNATSSIVLINGSGVSVELTGFTITGPGPSGCGSIRTGIYVYDGAYANIHANTVQDVRDSTFSGCQNGVAIAVGRQAWATTGTANIENNIIVGYQKGGIVADNTGSNVTIANNIVTGVGTTNIIAQNGIQISRGATATLSGNIVTGNSFHLDGNPWDWGSAGILFYQAGAVTMSGGNTVSDNDQNLYVDSTTAVTFGLESIGPSTAPLDWGYDVINLTTLDLDLTSANFPAATNNADIEARVWHQVDDPAVGLVTWTNPVNPPLLTVRVQDSASNPIEGAVITYAVGNPNAGWQTFGTTGADGTITRSDLTTGTDYHFYASYNTSNSLTQVVNFDGDDVVTFQTVPVKAKVETCAGAAIEGAVVTYGNPNGGFTSFGTTDIDGVALKELFPGYERHFYAGVNHTSSALQAVTVADQVDPLVVFKTTTVTINYTRPINHGSANGGWYPFTKPSMEMFAGTHTFLIGGVQIPLVVGDCNYTSSIAFVKLINSAGVGIAGATAQYYDGGWKDIPGVTNANGLLPVIISGQKGNVTFAINYAGARIQKSQNITADSYVIFQTKAVTVKLLNAAGTSELPADASYYASGWNTFGSTSTTATMELLPTTYPFKVSYLGGSIQKNQDVSVNPVVIFNTTSVTVKLLNEAGTADLTADADYYASGWKDFGTTPATLELLPTTYPFKVSYLGASIQKNQNVADNPEVVFNTKVVTVKLLSTSNAELPAEASYYASGWKPFGTTPTTAAMELLPTIYPFRVSYLGASIQKNQDVFADPVVTFNTVAVTFKLLSSTDAELPAEGAFYASGWKPFGDGTITEVAELLPTTYPFRVTYGGASIQKNQNIGTDPLVVFKTKLVTMKLLGAAGAELPGGSQYYANGWKTFGGGTTTTTIELLPTTYPFKVTYNGAGLQKNQNVDLDPLVIFTGTKVTLQFSGNIEYYAGGWKTFTKPTTTLLPGTYPFRFSGTGYPAIQVNFTVGADEIINSVAYIRLINSKGGGLAGGSAQYYGSGWQAIAGSTNSNGVVLGFLPGLKNSTTFKMSYAGASMDKTQNIAIDSFVVYQTVKAEVQLQDNTGTLNTLPSEGTAQYYASGWKDIGPTVDGKISIELLPLSYSFSMNYVGARQEFSQNVSTNSLVVFKTKLVEVQLQDSTGALGNIPNEGMTQYYASGWKDIGPTVDGKVSIELLPLSYPFRMIYIGAQQEFSQNVSTNPLVVFTTKLVEVQLQDSTGALGNLPNEGTAQYYASGWKDIGPTVDGKVSIELLPLSYSFAMNYIGARQEFTQNTGTNPIVIFRTGSVHSDSGTCTQYYAGGWKSFTQNMELLPGSYPFMFTGFPQTNYTVTAEATIHIH